MEVDTAQRDGSADFWVRESLIAWLAYQTFAIRNDRMNLSAPRILLHLEGLCVLLGVCILYSRLDYRWGQFAVFLLAPDISMFALLVNRKFGVICYNAVHTYIGPLVLLGVLSVSKSPEYIWIVLVWMAHIGMDRALGFGLKYESDLKRTHLHRA